MRWTKKITLSLIGFSIVLSLCSQGCLFNRKIIISPINNEDIITIYKGDKIVYSKDGSEIIVKEDGRFFTERYILDVIQLKLNK